MGQEKNNINQDAESHTAPNDVEMDEFLACGNIRETSGRVLGIDYGEKNIGLAMSDQDQKQAFAYATMDAKYNFWNKIKEICRSERIDKIVVGLPLNMNGQYTKKTEEVILFIETLEQNIKIPVETMDERLTTVEAKKMGAGYGIDEASAQIILQQYLDTQEIRSS